MSSHPPSPPPGPEDPFGSAGPGGYGPYGSFGPSGREQYPQDPYGRPPGQYPGHHPGQFPGHYAPNEAFPGSELVGADDPLVPRSFSEWVSKIVDTVSRSWQPLLVVQLVAALPALVLGGVAEGLVVDPSSLSGAAVAGLSAGAILFAVVAVVFGLFAQGASVFIVVRDAVGRPARAGEALSFAAGRALALFGWAVVAGLLLLAGYLVLVLPGVYMTVVFMAALTGVVVIERQGIGRTFALVNRRFWPTAGRMLVFGLAALLYNLVMQWVVEALAGGSPFVSSVLASVLALPVSLVLVGVTVVTYAELRNHENPSVGSGALAAQMEG